MCHFRAQNTPICLEQNILVQTIITTFIYLLTLFIGKISKKIIQRIQSYEDAPFLGPNDPFAPDKFFFGKLLISLSSTY